MAENKIEILKRLYDDGFVHKQDFNSKLKHLVKHLGDEEHILIQEKENRLEKENRDKNFQIDYFTLLLKSKIDLANSIPSPEFFHYNA